MRIEQNEIVDLLAQLNDRSLITPDERAAREPRYRLLETVRQFARDLLAEDLESETYFKRHLDHYCALVEACEPKLKGAEQREALQLLEHESENIRAALDRGTSGEGLEPALRIAASLALFWWRQGHFIEGTEWCLRAAATGLGEKRSVLRARLLAGAGFLTSFQGDSSTAMGYYCEARDILIELDDRQHLPEVLCGLGFSSFFLDEYDESRRFMDEAYRVSKEVNDLWFGAWCTYFLGILARVKGDFATAIRNYQESLSAYRKLGDQMSSSYPIYDIGLAEYYRGNFDEAERYLTESLAIRRESGDLWGVSEALFGLGLVSAAKRDLDQARASLFESKTVAEEIGDKTRIAICAHWLGQVALTEGELEPAVRLFDESLQIYRALEDRWGLAHCLAGSASLAAFREDWEQAVRLWAASEKLRDEIASPLPPSERAMRQEQLDETRKYLSAARFDECWSKGRDLDLEQALELADLFRQGPV